MPWVFEGAPSAKISNPRGNLSEAENRNSPHRSLVMRHKHRRTKIVAVIVALKFNGNRAAWGER
jgi:hypothetical protein